MKWVKSSLWMAIALVFLKLGQAVCQNEKQSRKAANRAAFYTGTYPNVFREAGYSQKDIDEKVAKAYHEVFEGLNRVYLEVGDSMGYVSDLKNHDAKTEGLSYGMMVPVQLNKNNVFDCIWRWSKKYPQRQDGPREAYFACLM